MHRRFGPRVNTAVVTRDPALLEAIYRDAERLPATSTIGRICAHSGFILDGFISSGNLDIQIAVRVQDGLPFALKLASELEYHRAQEWLNTIRNINCDYIIPMFTYATQRKYMIFMPLHPTTLESFPILPGFAVRRFFNNILEAISFIHNHQFIHNDVKSSNILVSTNGDFILADFGSLSRPGERSTSTKAYVPHDIWDHENQRIAQVAQPSTDWWMFASTLYEKVCGGDVGGGARDRTRGELIAELTNGGTVRQIPRDLADILLERLGF